MNNVFHVIKDPVHGTMQFTSMEDAWIKPFIDNPPFQRLRRIKQLGLGDYIFPGAVHTRFNHSLGCCYIACQIARKIGLSDAERQLVMIACLLHDIGHGPFSHAFEGIFADKSVQHEDWAPLFLNTFTTQAFFTDYKAINPRYPLTEEKFQSIADIIMHQSQQKSVLADIVSSQLDADRLDYLLRDSHFCGVRYGEFDFRWLLNCLSLVPTTEGERLGITHKGIGAVEQYLMARRLMLRNIYHGQKNLSLEAFLVEMLAQLAKDLLDFLPFKTLQTFALGQFLIATNQFNHALKTSQNIKQLKQEFIQANYDHYRKLYDDDVIFCIRSLAEMPENHAAIQLAKRLQYRMLPKILRLDHYNLQVVHDVVMEFKHTHRNLFQDWQIKFIQTPQHAYSGAHDPIYVINENGLAQTIDYYSMMLGAMSDRYEQVVFLSIDKVIADHELVVKLQKNITTMPHKEASL